MTTNLKPTVSHATYEIRRTFDHPPERVFRAWSDPAAKRKWYADDGKSHSLDFTVGGRELSVSGPTPMGVHVAETVYMDIVPPHRIVFAYSMLMDGRRHSSSLVTLTFAPDGDATGMIFTEQAAFFEGSDGADVRKHGWTALLDQLANYLTN